MGDGCWVFLRPVGSKRAELERGVGIKEGLTAGVADGVEVDTYLTAYLVGHVGIVLNDGNGQVVESLCLHLADEVGQGVGDSIAGRTGHGSAGGGSIGADGTCVAVVVGAVDAVVGWQGQGEEGCVVSALVSEGAFMKLRHLVGGV